MSRAFLFHADCKEFSKRLPDNSIDSVVCDPPYEYGFMGNSWDTSGIAFDVDMWKDVKRALKPGGYMMVFGASKMFHRVAVALEDAGFEIIVIIPWIYTSGMPKGGNISLNIDKTLGHTRPDRVVAEAASNRVLSPTVAVLNKGTPVSEEAKKWDGWSTQLKSANEPVILCQKRLSEKTVAKNVLKWGVGGINLAGVAHTGADGVTRVAPDVLFTHSYDCTDDACDPACPVYELGEQNKDAVNCYPAFRYNKKASSKERPFIMQPKCVCDAYTFLGNKNIDPETITGEQLFALQAKLTEKSDADNKCAICLEPYEKFVHKTVKPLDLIRWMVRLVTPPGGTVYEPFAGTGTTIEASLLEGFNVISTEKFIEHLPLIEKRLEPYMDQVTVTK